MSDAISAAAKAVAQIADIVRDDEADAGRRKYRYATLGAVLAKVRPALAAESLAIRVETEQIEVRGSDNGVEWVGRDLRATAHIYGMGSESILRASATVPILGFELAGGARAVVDAQAIGSAQTYATRYAVLAVCGVAPVDEDDDGVAASSCGGANSRNVGSPATPAAEAPRTVRDTIIEVRERKAGDRTAYDVTTRAGLALGTLNTALAAAARAAINAESDITYSQRGRFCDLRDVVRVSPAAATNVGVAAVAAANRAAVAAGRTQEQVRAWWSEHCPDPRQATADTLADLATWSRGDAA